MIRINAVEHFGSLSAGSASQGTVSRDVKEDLNTTISSLSNAIRNNFSLNQSLECWQKYRLYCFIRYFCTA